MSRTMNTLIAGSLPRWITITPFYISDFIFIHIYIRKRVSNKLFIDIFKEKKPINWREKFQSTDATGSADRSFA